MRIRTLLWPTLLACATSCGRIGFDPGAGGDGGPSIDGPTVDMNVLPPDKPDMGVIDPDLLWWNPAWSYRVRVSFDAATLEAEMGAFEDLIDIPLAIRIEESGLDPATIQVSAADVRFVASDNQTELAYEIERRPTTDGSVFGSGAVFWVKVPSIRVGDPRNYIWLYYGNPEAMDGQQPAAVWSADYVAVWHLGERLGERRDSARDGHHLLGEGQVGAEQDGDLLLGDSVRLSPSDPTPLQHPPFAEPGAVATTFTVEAFINPDIDGADMMIAGMSGANGQRSFELRRLADQQIEFLISLNCTDEIKSYYQGPAEVGRWHHIAATYDGDVMRMYHDGVLVNEQAVIVSSKYPVCYGQAPFMLGALDAQALRFSGRADELRLSSRTQSPAWLRAQYLAVRASLGKLIVYGAHETRP